MRELLNAIGFLGIRQGANLILSIVRAKILAVILGPAGVGIVSQASNFQNLMWSLTNGVSRGLTVITADSNSREDFTKINRILITSFIFLTVFGGVILLVCSQFADQIAVWIFNSQEYSNFVIIIAGSAWFAIQTSMIMAVFRGLLKIRAYTFSFVLGYLFTILGMVILIRSFGLVGAIFSILVGQVINCLIAMIILRFHVLKRYPEIGWFRTPPGWDALHQILSFFGPMLIVQIVMGTANLILRGELIRRLGENANGFYQVVWGISLAYMTLINDTSRSYVVPKIASHLNKPEETLQILNNMLRIYLILLSPFLIALLAFREIWIPILYSDAFIAAGSLLFWQFAGDILKTFRININSALIPHKRFGYMIFEESISWSVWIGLSLWMIPYFGLVSIPIGYFISALVVTGLCLMYQYIVMKFRILPENRVMIVKLLPILVIGFACAQLITPLWLRIPIIVAVIGGMLLWLPTASERKKGIFWLSEIFSSYRETISN